MWLTRNFRTQIRPRPPGFIPLWYFKTVHASRCLYCHCVIMRLTLVGLPWHWCSGVPAGPGPPSSCLTVEHSQLVIHAICAHLLLFTSQVAEDSVYRWHLNDKLHMIKVRIRVGWSAVSFCTRAHWCGCAAGSPQRMHIHLIIKGESAQEDAPAQMGNELVWLYVWVITYEVMRAAHALYLIRLNGWMPISFSSAAWEKKSFHVAN